MHRRDFLSSLAMGAAGMSLLHVDPRNRACAEQRRSQDRGANRITAIERHEICIPYREFNAERLFRYHGVKLQLRTIFVAKTESGAEGIGEAWGAGWPKDDDLKKYIGSTPFDWIGSEVDLPINMAIYDLIGKLIGQPAWKLIGPQVRKRVPVAAWTVSLQPKWMAVEVRRAAAAGYRWLKYHVDELQNVVDQTAAIQRVAPDGFRMHYDFNANSTMKAMAPVLRELNRFPVVGRLEDPINPVDRDGYRKLRELMRPEVLIHHGPTDMMSDQLVDGLMAGHAAVGAAAKIAALAEHHKTPIMLQNAGGDINQAFLAHQASVYRMATIDHVNLAHLWSDDVVGKRTVVEKGGVAVPRGPGLGVKLDREKLTKYEQAPRPEYSPFLIRIRYEGGPTIYARHNPDLPGSTDNMRLLQRLLKQKENLPGPTPGYGNRVASAFLDKENFGEFESYWRRTAGGHVVEL